MSDLKLQAWNLKFFLKSPLFEIRINIKDVDEITQK